MANDPEDDQDDSQDQGSATSSDAEDAGVEVDAPDDTSDITENPDGSVTVEMDEEDEDELDAAKAMGFYDNLAAVIEPGKLNEIAGNLLDLIRQDKDDRADRDLTYAEGLRRTGMGKETPKAAFDNGSEAVFPILTEVSIDFASKAIKEIMPANGPVRDKIIGVPTKAKIEKARRKVRYLNYVLTEKMPEFRSDLEAVLSQLPLGGSQGLKVYYDRSVKRLRCEPVYVDHMLIPGAATSWASAERKTHIQKLSQQDFQRRIDDGTYLVEGPETVLISGQEPDKTEAEQAAESIEGATTDPTNLDGLRTVYETVCYLDLSKVIPADVGTLAAEAEGHSDGIKPPAMKPYLVSLDEQSGKILSIYRNWRMDDASCRELQHIVQFRFVPWRGAYGIGLVQMIGGLAIGATGALRALLDSALMSTIPTGVRLPGASGKGGQNLRPKPGQFVEIEGGLVPGTDDVRKMMMPFQFPAPSPVLLTLLGTLSDTAKGVVSTALENIPDNPANMPVGTTQALIEQGMTVFSAIHARLHDSFGQVLKIIHRLLEQELDEDSVIDDTGELLVRAEDFKGPMDVVPVSDPNVFSEQQRFAQMQAIIARSDVTGLYDRRKVEELFLERLKVPNGKDLLLPAQTPQRLNAVNENVAATMKRPIVSFPDQDHESHIKVHLEYAFSPMLGGNPIIGLPALPMLLNHIKEHIAFLYAILTSQFVENLTGVDANELMKNDGDDDDFNEQKNQEFDKLLADAMPQVLSQIEQTIGKYMPQIQQLQQIVGQITAPQAQMPPDPMAMAAQAETQRKAQADQMKAANDAEKIQLQQAELQQQAQEDQTHEQQETQRDQMRIEAENRRTLIQQQGDTQRNTADNDTAMRISAAELAAGHASDLRTGTGINPDGRV